MTARARHPLGLSHRLGVVFFALFFATTLAAAPLTHPATCSGACDAGTTAGTGHGVDDGVPDGAPACHGQGNHRGDSAGCTCTDDCCSLIAQFVAVPILADGAPPALLVSGAIPTPPDDARRAPAPRLLPYPTGPPAAL